MSRLDDWVEQTLLPPVSRLSGRSVTAVLLLIYIGGGLALPMLLDVPKSWLFTINCGAVSVAALVGMLWMAGQLKGWHRRLLVEWTTNLRHLDAAEFEWLVGEIFRREGWTVRETGRQDGPDGNIDLELTGDGKRVIVQCKRWTAKPVGIDEVRKLAGTLMRVGLPGNAGILVTLSRFNEQARVEALKVGLTLIDGAALYERMDALRRPEHCPDCSRPMQLDHSVRGWWFRCVAPGCAGKRDLGSDPARALEFLTRQPQ